MLGVLEQDPGQNRTGSIGRRTHRHLSDGRGELVAIDASRPGQVRLVEFRKILHCQLTKAETRAFAQDLDFAITGPDRDRTGRHLAHRLGHQTAGNNETTLLHHLDFDGGANRHLEICAGDCEGPGVHLTQHTLEDGQCRADSNSSVRSCEDISEVVSISSDTHRSCSLLRLL